MKNLKFYIVGEKILLILSISSLLWTALSYILWRISILSNTDHVAISAIISITSCLLFPLFIAVSTHFVNHKVGTLYSGLVNSLKFLLCWVMVLVIELVHSIIITIGDNFLDFLPTLFLLVGVSIVVCLNARYFFKNPPVFIK